MGACSRGAAALAVLMPVAGSSAAVAAGGCHGCCSCCCGCFFFINISANEGLAPGAASLLGDTLRAGLGGDGAAAAAAAGCALARAAGAGCCCCAAAEAVGADCKGAATSWLTGAGGLASAVAALSPVSSDAGAGTGAAIGDCGMGGAAFCCCSAVAGAGDSGAGPACFVAAPPAAAAGVAGAAASCGAAVAGGLLVVGAAALRCGLLCNREAQDGRGPAGAAAGPAVAAAAGAVAPLAAAALVAAPSCCFQAAGAGCPPALLLASASCGRDAWAPRDGPSCFSTCGCCCSCALPPAPMRGGWGTRGPSRLLALACCSRPLPPPPPRPALPPA